MENLKMVKKKEKMYSEKKVKELIEASVDLSLEAGYTLGKLERQKVSLTAKILAYVTIVFATIGIGYLLSLVL